MLKTCRIQATGRLQSSLSGMQVLNAYLSNGSCYQPVLGSHGAIKRLAKALIRLRVCAGWSEPLLVAHNLIVGNLMSRLKYVRHCLCNALYVYCRGRAVANVGKTCGPTPCFVLAINTFKLSSSTSSLRFFLYTLYLPCMLVLPSETDSNFNAVVS